MFASLLSLPKEILFSKHRYLDKCKIVMCLLFFPLTLHMYFSREIKLFSVFPLLYSFPPCINLFPTTTDKKKLHMSAYPAPDPPLNKDCICTIPQSFMIFVNTTL